MIRSGVLPDRITRRHALQRSGLGMSWLACASLLSESSAKEVGDTGRHHQSTADRVLFLFMDGGPSQVDTFDPKPELQEYDGKPFPASIDATQFDQNGKCFGSPFRFQKYGDSGLEISELFPHLSKYADDLCVIRSMKSEFAEHSQACMYLHTGFAAQGRPSMGAWLGYGLGTENEQLPSYVVVHGGLLPIGGPENFSSAFLPAVYSGSIFDSFSGGELVRNITPGVDVGSQRELLNYLNREDQRFLRQQPALSREFQMIESAIKSYETAGKMQTSVPELADFSGESAELLTRYGVDSKDPLTAQYAKECILARRLLERGVRYVEVTCVKGVRFIAPWDDHDNLEGGHRRNANVVDQPIAALLGDLKDRGLLDRTLVVFAGEFGRTPFAQGGKGRDHNPQGFSIWMAGGGVRGGMAYGATDAFGYRAVENVVSMHDLHATILHALGIDHERLTYRWGGRDFRLTDVHGRVVREVLKQV
jgi:hypothetical protein